MTSIQFLLREPRSERQVLEALHRTLGLVIETIDSPVPDAVGLAQGSTHCAGFAQAWLVTWPGETKAERTFNECAPALASQFNVDILVECGGAEDCWLLFSPDGRQMPVGVLETSDGIEVVQPPV